MDIINTFGQLRDVFSAFTVQGFMNPDFRFFTGLIAFLSIDDIRFKTRQGFSLLSIDNRTLVLL